MTGRPTVAVAVHDGFYGVGTGAGYANRAFLHVLTDFLVPGVRLVVLPVRLTPSSAEYDSAWHQSTVDLISQVGATVRPVNNGTAGLVRFGGRLAFRQLAFETANAVLNDVVPDADPLAIIVFDVPFLGIPPQLPPKLLPHLTVVPRSTGRLHDPTNTERIGWERRGLLSVAHHGGRVAAISAYMRAHLRDDYHVPNAALVDLPDGLILEEWQFGSVDPALIPARGHAGFLLAMGRAQPYKGWDDLLDALAILHRRHQATPHVLLAAVTENEIPSDYQRHLARRIDTLRLDVTLLTNFDPKIRDLLTHRALRAVIVPSRAEPFGRIPLEAALIVPTPGPLLDPRRAVRPHPS